jgi:hypothetical protein
VREDGLAENGGVVVADEGRETELVVDYQEELWAVRWTGKGMAMGMGGLTASFLSRRVNLKPGRN